MRLLCILFLSIFLFNNCALNIQRLNYIKNNENRVEIQPSDIQIVKYAHLTNIDITKLGTVTLSQMSNTGNCDEILAVKKLKKEAVKLGANLINIIVEEYPDFYSDCYRCAADLYYIEKNKNIPLAIYGSERDTLVYSMNKKLSWNDFKANPPKDETPHKVQLNCQMFVKFQNLYPGKSENELREFETHAVTFKDDSWVKPEYKTDYNLKHQQVKFDIVNVFSQRYKNQIKNKFGPFPQDYPREFFVLKVFSEYSQQLNDTIAKYEHETNFGKDTLQQMKWNEKVLLETNRMKIKEPTMVYNNEFAFNWLFLVAAPILEVSYHKWLNNYFALRLRPVYAYFKDENEHRGELNFGLKTNILGWKNKGLYLITELGPYFQKVKLDKGYWNIKGVMPKLGLGYQLGDKIGKKEIASIEFGVNLNPEKKLKDSSGNVIAKPVPSVMIGINWGFMF